MKKRVLTLVAGIALAGILCFTSGCKKNPPQACISDLNNVMLKGQSQTFKSCSNGATGYLWDFGDGTTANTPTVSHAYNAGGTFTCRLTVSNGDGNSLDTFRIQVIDSKPDACINNVPATVQALTVIDFQTCPSLGASYQWNFGDGNTASGTTPTHAYSDTGTYTITLTAFNIFGSSVKQQSILVTQANPANKSDYVGTYNFTESCLTNQPSYIATITALGGDTILINNLGAYGHSVNIKGIINGSIVYIPNQSAGGNVISTQGSGTLSSNRHILTITHQDVLSGGGNDACTGTGTKQ